MNKKTRVIRFFESPEDFYLLKFFGNEKKYKLRKLPKGLIDKKEFASVPFSSLPNSFNTSYFYKVRF